MTANFFDCIYQKLIEKADCELIVWPELHGSAHTHTGTAILSRVSVIRAGLLGAGVRPGQSVLLALPVSFELICSLLAVMALGAIPVLPPAMASLFTLFSVIKREGISAVITQRKQSRLLSWLMKSMGVKLVSVANQLAWSGTYLLPHPVDSEQPALISHSSGSTGRAKAIRRSHRVLRAQHQALSMAFPSWPGQRDFPLFPNVLLHNLAVGSVSVLPDLPHFKLTQLDPARIVAQLATQGVHTLTGNVCYFQRILRYLAVHPQAFAQVRAVGIGGSPVPESLVHRLKIPFPQADIYIIYGASEAEPIAVRNTGQQPATPRFGYAVGTIHPAIQLNIRPLGTIILPGGKQFVTGEIEVRGPHVATTSTNWLQTGDFGYIDEENQLVLTGRKGNEQIHRGVQHYQIEHILSLVDGVDRVAARADVDGFTLFVQGSAGEPELRYVLNANFPEGICPRICFRPQLPVDARHLSKIRYDKLT